MTKRDALKLKSGDKVVNTHTNKSLTVKAVIPEPTPSYSKGTFPLVEMEEEPDEATTYKLLRRAS